MGTPLLDKVKAYKEIDLRFHTPAQSKNVDEELYSNYQYDVTELDWSDNLISPDGVLLEAEKLLAEAYHAKRTLMITSGATVGNFIAMNVLKSVGGKVLVTANCHKSIYNACKLFSINSVFMEDVYQPNGLPRPISLEEIEEYLTDDVRSVVITSPTYFGECVKTEVITSLQKKGLTVFVDQAHGGHFVYSSLLPDSLSSVADLVVDSVHKTLPVYTGGALLQVNNEAILTETEFYHSILH